MAGPEWFDGTEEGIHRWLSEVVHTQYPPRGGGGCMVAAEVVEDTLGWRKQDGIYWLGKSLPDAIANETVYEHWWNVKPNGDIFDGTAGQFAPSGDIIKTVPRSSPEYEHYTTWDDTGFLDADQMEQLQDIVQWSYPKFASRPTYYHGSRFDLPVGTILVPGGPDGPRSDEDGDQYVWITQVPEVAENHGSVDGSMNYIGPGHVYEVEPIGEIEDRSDAKRPGHSFVVPKARIVRKVSAKADITFTFDAGFVLEGDTYAAITAHEGSTKVGSLTWIVPAPGKSTEISFIWVKPTHRRQGLATRMLAEARKAVTYRIGLSNDFTDMGRAWSKTVAASRPQIDPEEAAEALRNLPPALREQFQRLMDQDARERSFGQGGKWYHASPADLPPGTILRPGGGPATDQSFYDAQADQDAALGYGERAAHVWITPDRNDASFWATVVGGKSIYEVEPTNPRPWGLSGADGYVCDEARIIKRISRTGSKVAGLPVYYHGTYAYLPPGTILTPSAENQNPSWDYSAAEPWTDHPYANVVWMTDDPAMAAHWADSTAGDGKAHYVYAVQPLGPVDKNLWGAQSTVDSGFHDTYTTTRAVVLHEVDPATGSKVATLSGPYYHGTNVALPIGSTIVPAVSSGTRNFDAGEYPYYDPFKVYLTDNVDHAWRYARSAVGKQGGEPHVYRVKPFPEPTRDVEYLETGWGSDQWVTSSATIVEEVSNTKVAYADFPIDEGKIDSSHGDYSPDDPDFEMPRTRGDWGFYGREKMMFRAGMPRGQQFRSAQDISRYVKPLLPGIDVQVIVAKGAGGMADSVLSRDKTKARLRFTSDMTWEWVVLHEVAHLRHRLNKGRGGASHGFDYAGEWADLMYQQLGWRFDFGFPVAASKASAISTWQQATYKVPRTNQKISAFEWKRTTGDRQYLTSFVGKNGRTYYLEGNYDSVSAFTEEPFERVGKLTSWNWNGRREIYKVAVNERHRRQGVATAMLALAREFHPDLVHAQPIALSEDGKAWSEKVGAKDPSIEVTSKPLTGTIVSERDRLSGDGIVYEATILGSADGRRWDAGFMRLRRRLSDGVWEVWHVYVDEDFRRKGVATAMIEQARADLGRVDHAPVENRTYYGRDWSKVVGSKVAAAMTYDEFDRIVAWVRKEYGYALDECEGDDLEAVEMVRDTANGGYADVTLPGRLSLADVNALMENRYPEGWSVTASRTAAQSVGDERTFGRFIMRYTQRYTGAKPEHVITTYDGKYEHRTRQVGEMVWHGTKHSILDINVDPAYRHQGIATAMWEWSQEMRPKAKHSTDRTDDGDAWARSVGGTLSRRNTAKRTAARPGPGPYYHGTPADLPPGTILTNDHPARNKGRMEGRVWATTRLDVAAIYGGHIYEVEPLSEPVAGAGSMPDADPEAFADDWPMWWSSGWRVVREVPNIRSEASSGLWWHASPTRMPVGTVLIPSGPEGPESRTGPVTPGREDDKNWVWMADTSAAYHYALKLSIRDQDPYLYLVRPLDKVEWRSFDWEDVPVTKRAEIAAVLPLRWEEDIRTNNDPYELDGKTQWGGKARMEQWKRAFEQGRTIEAAWTGEDAVDRHKALGDVMPEEWGTFNFDFMLHRANKALADHYGVPKPDLQITTSTYMPLNGNLCLGQYDPLRQTIWLSPTHDDSLSVLAHEFTHHLDHIRGIDDWRINDWSDEPRRHSDAFYRRVVEVERTLRKMIHDLIPDGYEMPRTAGFGDSPEDQKALEDLARILTEPTPGGRDYDILPPAHELYGGFIQEGSDHRLYVDGEPVSTLYRVVDPAEWTQAQAQGYLQSRGGYTRASAKPDERWRRQGPSNVPGLTLEIDYDPADGWHASAEGYAATHKRIPLSRVRNRGPLTAREASVDGDEHWYHATCATLPPGTMLVPGGPGGAAENFPGLYDQEPWRTDYVWVDGRPQIARMMATISGCEDPIVYRVQPIDLDPTLGGTDTEAVCRQAIVVGVYEGDFERVRGRDLS